MDREPAHPSTDSAAIDRRSFLLASARASLGTWSACARDGAATERGSTARGPLLVLLEHDDASGLYWGAYLDLVSDAGAADLALCDLAFETPQRARKRLPAGATFQAGIALWIDVPGAPPVFIAKPPSPPAFDDLVDSRRAEHLHPWLDETERALHAVIAPDEETFARRARLVLGASAGPRSQSEARLTAMGRERLARSAPRGAKWARSAGCGALEFEDGTSESAGYACGMGSLTGSARRFLHAYTAK